LHEAKCSRCGRVSLVELRALKHPPDTPVWKTRGTVLRARQRGRHHTRRQRAHILGLTYARLSCTAVSRLIRALDTRKTRARLDRLVRDGKIERKREQGNRGPVYLFRRHS